VGSEDKVGVEEGGGMTKTRINPPSTASTSLASSERKVEAHSEAGDGVDEDDEAASFVEEEEGIKSIHIGTEAV